MSTQNYEVRPLKPHEDIPYHLLLLADETKEIINRYITANNIFVLEQDGLLIAQYVLQPINHMVAEIKNIAVAEHLQGKGIGRFMLNDAAQRAKSAGFKTLLIGTADAAVKQLYLYQKAGFEVSFIKKHFFTDNYPEPIYENGILLKHMVMLEKQL